MQYNHSDIIIRVATLEDVPAILAIYAPYVEKTAITFEYDVPSLAEFQARMKKTLTKYPYIVAEKSGEIVGYAYTSAFVGRAAYNWAVETTIYLQETQTKSGLGKKLYTVIENISKAQHIYNLNACIGYPEKEDQYLTKNSADFHRHLGYRLVGEFHKCGYKFGTWYNMVWMEKLLGQHSENPEPVIWFPQLDRKVLQNLGITL
ncbi:GNAT family N-acetyltransferase [Gallibacterium trehalosifermentans]|uniref:GNAT family N-acetyltransferase n=1 Tax=Gallibacterium trehalosifermentans TaxID=516935 RepID=A0ABV6GYC2_9PAST